MNSKFTAARFVAMPLCGAAVAMFSGITCAATIYECRAYGGSTFYSSGSCSLNNAIGVINHTVPDGMTFDQQVKVLEAAKNSKAANSRAEDADRSRLGHCAQLEREINALHAKYTSWEYVPVDEVNADQRRERDLKSRRSQLRCYSR